MTRNVRSGRTADRALGVLLLVAGLSAAGVGAASAQASPPAHVMLTSAFASSIDPGLHTRCLHALGQSSVAALCDSYVRGMRRTRLRAPAFRMQRVPGVAVLAGRRPLYPRSRVEITRLRPSRRAQLVVLYRSSIDLVYARFSGLKRTARAVVVAKPTARGSLYIRLEYSKHTVRPAVQKRIAAPPAAPPPIQSPPGTIAPNQALPCGTSAVGVTCDAYFDALWRPTGPGWAGGDVAMSVPLPDGRDAWLFGDTFIGTILPDGTRSPDTRLLRNSLVVQSGDQLTTITGPGTTSVIPEPAPERWYWPADGIVEGNELRVFVHQFERSGYGAWEYHYMNAAIASFSLPGLIYQGLHPVPESDDVGWGTWLMSDGGYTYIYGYPVADGATPVVARAAHDDLDGDWEYFDGSGWSTSPDDLAAIASGVPIQYAVVPVDGGYAMISTGTALSPELFTRFSASPTGPFGAAKLLYTAPVTDEIFAYNAVAHPEHVEGGRLLVSYCVNALEWGDLFTNPDYYRPRFVRVPVEALSGTSPLGSER
jgi:hypothetical protein